jgi:hypothetical protein
MQPKRNKQQANKQNKQHPPSKTNNSTQAKQTTGNKQNKQQYPGKTNSTAGTRTMAVSGRCE